MTGIVRLRPNRELALVTVPAVTAAAFAGWRLAGVLWVTAALVAIAQQTLP